MQKSMTRYLLSLVIVLFTCFISQAYSNASGHTNTIDKPGYSNLISEDDDGINDHPDNEDTFDEDDLYLGPNDDPYFDDHDVPEPDIEI